MGKSICRAIACSSKTPKSPHPNPLPEYRARGKEGEHTIALIAAH
jgi:hypothetical protein